MWITCKKANVKIKIIRILYTTLWINISINLTYQQINCITTQTNNTQEKEMMATTGEGSMKTSDTFWRFIISEMFTVNLSFTKLVPQSNRLECVSVLLKINRLLDCSVLSYERHFSTYPQCIWNLQLLDIIILYQVCPWFVLYLKLIYTLVQPLFSFLSFAAFFQLTWGARKTKTSCFNFHGKCYCHY
jgi:hypothetical protein